MVIVSFQEPTGQIRYVTEKILSCSLSAATSEIGSLALVLHSLPSALESDLRSRCDVMVEVYWKNKPNGDYTLIFGGFVSELKVVRNSGGVRYVIQAESYESILRRRYVAYPRSYTPDNLTYFSMKNVGYILSRIVEYNLGTGAASTNRYRNGLFTFNVTFAGSGGSVLPEYRCEEREVYSVFRELTGNGEGWFTVTRTGTNELRVTYTYNMSSPTPVDFIAVSHPRVAELSVIHRPAKNGQTIAKYGGSEETASILTSQAPYAINGFEQLMSVRTRSQQEAQWSAEVAELTGRKYEERMIVKTTVPAMNWLNLGAAFRVSNNDPNDIRCLRAYSFSADGSGNEQFVLELGGIR